MPDLVTFCRVQRESAAWRPGEYLPFHRAGSGGPPAGSAELAAPSPAVLSADGSESYPDFASFLASLAPRRQPLDSTK